MSTPFNSLVPITSLPGSTNSGADTTLLFVQEVIRVIVQNNTAADVWVNTDAPAAIGALWRVAQGGQLLELNVSCGAVHLFTAAAQTINSGAAGVSVAGYAR